MAQKTQLSAMATPGRVLTFVAKAPAVPEGQPIWLRATTVPYMRYWHPRGLK